MEKTGIVVCGAGGRMGRLIIQLAMENPGVVVTAGVETDSRLAGEVSSMGIRVVASLSDLSLCGNVVIDFTKPEATSEIIGICAEKRAGAVVGTTGLNKAQKDKVAEASEVIPVFFAPNMSLGVNLFMEVIRVASSLMKEYEAEISEIHHHFKKDAPSGTARKIAEIICETTGRRYEDVAKCGREGTGDARSRDEIGIHSLRIGDIVGEHSVYFGGRGEIMEFTHRCYNRESFASGALKAARFISGKKAGMYNMQDLIKEETKVC